MREQDFNGDYSEIWPSSMDIVHHPSQCFVIHSRESICTNREFGSLLSESQNTISPIQIVDPLFSVKRLRWSGRNISFSVNYRSPDRKRISREQRVCWQRSRTWSIGLLLLELISQVPGDIIGKKWTENAVQRSLKPGMWTPAIFLPMLQHHVICIPHLKCF